MGEIFFLSFFQPGIYKTVQRHRVWLVWEEITACLAKKSSLPFLLQLP